MNRLYRVVRPLFAFLLLLSSLATLAQHPEPRLGKSISDTTRVVLAQSRTPQVRSAQDLGPVAADTKISGITLAFRRTPAQETALGELLSAQQDPASPSYHHWLTPEAFATRFGMADEDITTVEAWLSAHGFHIDSVARSRDRITFSGSASQVQTAFGTELHRYRVHGELHFAPASDLTLPASLASVTAAILHLSDFRPKPNYKAIDSAHPNYTTETTQTNYLGPKDILTMYDGNAFANNFIYGAGQQLAVVGQSFVNVGTPSAIDTFQGFLAQPNPVSIALVPGSGAEAFSPGDQAESELDLEYASGIAQPNVLFIFVGANQNYSAFDAMSYSITEDIAPVISVSYSECEPLMSQSELALYDATFEEASAQGQTLVVSSGDSGSTACAQFSIEDGLTAAEQQELSVNFPASSPNVTAVGGTQMAAGTFAAGNATYWAPANTYMDNTSSLLSYVPETAWNEGTAARGATSGGGGSSMYYPRPTWQKSFPGMPKGSYRLLPDISLQSSIASPGFLMCTSDPALYESEGQTGSCVNGLLGSNDKFTTAGGTSFAAPIFAGFLALLNEQEHATGQGNINPTLYSLAAKPASYAAAFHDITSGTNACPAGATTCAAADESSYTATTGYDEATGLGSVDFNALASAWPASSTQAIQSTSVLVTGINYVNPPSQTVSVEIYVSALLPLSAVTNPGGTVSVTIDGTVVNPALPFTSVNSQYQQATIDYNFTAPATAGSHLLRVTYSGDATHAPSTATYPVTVGSLTATGGLALAVGNITVTDNSSGSSQVTITPNGGYDGRLIWSLSITAATSTSSALTACYSIDSVPVSAVTTTKLSIGTGSTCNAALPSDRASLRVLSRTAANPGAPPTHPSKARAIYAGLLILGCLTGGRRKWRLSLLPMLFLLILISFGTTGCGGNGGSSGSGTSTSSGAGAPATAGTYTVMLTGLDSVDQSITASANFTLTVN